MHQLREKNYLFLKATCSQEIGVCNTIRIERLKGNNYNKLALDISNPYLVNLEHEAVGVILF
ncbi:hypothetical protein LBMAG20_04240 [Methylocystaceae bacterium]|nr:hypothetical protein LBMAG20_04240 [Methylocystaceae bacterium]